MYATRAPRLSDYQVEIGAEPVEQRTDQGDDVRSLVARAVRNGASHGQEECVLPDEARKRTAGGAERRSEIRIPVIPVTMKDQRLPSFRIVVGVLVEHLVIVDFEAVLPADSVEDQVDRETGGPFSTLATEEEWVSRELGLLISLTKRVENDHTHVRHGAENRRLPRGVGAEDPGNRQDVHRRRASRGCQLPDDLCFGQSRSEQREVCLLPV